MDPTNIVLILIALSIIISIIVIFGRMNAMASSSQSKSDMKSAIDTVIGINTILTVLMAISGWIYIASNPLVERPYMFFLLHLCILLSSVSVGISVLERVK